MRGKPENFTSLGSHILGIQLKQSNPQFSHSYITGYASFE